MKNDYPRSIEIVCEGYEEYDYFYKLKTLDIFSKSYSIKLKNAKSMDNIFSVYSNEFQNNNSEVVFVLCDTDLFPYEKYMKLCKSINDFHGKKKISYDVVLFVNPCTMQMMLSHFDEIKLKSNQKGINAPQIAKLTGVKDYRATEEQRKAFMNHITAENYQEMKSRLKKMETDYRIQPSSNVLSFLANLESDNSKWIDKIIKQY